MSCYCSLQQSVAVCSSLLLLFSSPVIAAGHQIELPKASAEMVRSGADFYLMLQAACYEPHAAACGSVFVLPCRLCAGSLTRARGGRTRKWSHLRLSLISWSVECVPAQLKAQMLSSQQSMGDEMPERIRCTCYDTQREREMFLSWYLVQSQLSFRLRVKQWTHRPTLAFIVRSARIALQTPSCSLG